VQQTIGIAAAKLLEEIQQRMQLWLMPRCESENKWIILLFHAALARLTTQADATLCGSRLSCFAAA
jgi:hypothetical protein